MSGNANNENGSSRLSYIKKQVAEKVNGINTSIIKFGGDPALTPARFKRHDALEHVVSKELLAFDELTGLRAKNRFIGELGVAVAEAKRDPNAAPLILVLADIDHFKEFNDKWDYNVGDDVLRAVGHTLRSKARTSDATYRNGGEEFAVLSHQTENDQPITSDYALPERIRTAIEETKVIINRENNDIPLGVTVSLGFVEYQQGESRDSFYSRAMDALFVAKGIGRNRTVSAEIRNGKNVYWDILTKNYFFVERNADGKRIKATKIADINTY